ncbi:MAG: cytochrome P450 [Chloroflexi bacterium]|nr:cytochrome P450 [Chloroflexota bacterium]MCI0581088.1 cytochrome P450 [Chloroflexota bacterium]MCI0644110.1 cytochrome P450 [Chloroflexota bacterium]MCI0729635.1 cytochrome P450 [Chloroflexota bacterium]
MITVTERTPPAPRQPKKAPGPPGHFLWGSVKAFQQDPLQTYMDAVRRYGDLVRYRFGPLSAYLISHPEDVKHVLQDNHRNYRNGFIRDLFFKPFLGEGLLTSEGELWRRQRHLIQPAFHRKHLATFDAITAENTARMIARWEAFAASGEPVDITKEFAWLTFRVVARAVFGADVKDAAGTVERAVSMIQKHVSYRMTHLFTFPEYVPTPHNRRVRRVARELDEIVYSIIHKQGEAGEGEGNLLSVLQSALDEKTGEGMSKQQLRDEVLVLLLAGHETTTYALGWTWYLLSKHPGELRRLRAELKAVLNGQMPTLEDLPRLTYTEQVIKEAIRLYPPTWAITRASIADDVVGGYHIGANALIFVSPYVTHRHPDFWENPERFDPERFSTARCAERARYAYIPFGGGPRHCIGSDMAMMEAIMVVAMVAQKYDLQLAPGYPVRLKPLVTLRPEAGIYMTMHRLED